MGLRLVHLFAYTAFALLVFDQLVVGVAKVRGWSRSLAQLLVWVAMATASRWVRVSVTKGRLNVLQPLGHLKILGSYLKDFLFTIAQIWLSGEQRVCHLKSTKCIAVVAYSHILAVSWTFHVEVRHCFIAATHAHTYCWIVFNHWTTAYKSHLLHYSLLLGGISIFLPISDHLW